MQPIVMALGKKPDFEASDGRIGQKLCA